MSNSIVKADPIGIIPVDQISHQVNEIQRLMQRVMKEDTHFGKIPGCGDKPTLLQPGAQKLCLMFQLADDYQIEQTDLPGDHREYRVKCTLTHKGSGIVQGSGYGICSTMESKYRYRVGPMEFTGKPVPPEYWNNGRDQKVLGGKGYTAKKNPDTGMWEIAKRGEKVENPDIADTYNTVLKMACKRALVHATLNTTAASDIFAQDLEDTPSAQPTATEPPDPFDQYRAALSRAKNERGISVHEAMAAVEKQLGKKREAFTQADIVRACEIVEGMGSDDGDRNSATEPAMVSVADPALEHEDIGF